MKSKVLITTNPLNHEGGVVELYNLILKHFKSEKFIIEQFNIGSRSGLFYYPVLKRIVYPFFFLFDFIRYIIKLLFDRNIKIVQVNPSLIPVPLIRDGCLIIIAKLLRKKVVVFYHGWKPGTLNLLKKRKIIRYFFNIIFQKNTNQIVLASSFKNDLELLGATKKNKIIVSTTAIDKNEIIIKSIAESPVLKVLFLGRVQKLKGVDEIIDSIIELKHRNKLENFSFTIVGHEEPSGYINILKDKLIKNDIGIDKVSFPGRITGEKKFELYAENNIFLLPSYTEGCPVSVLEALSSGLFCITTDVGALADVIKNKKNGIIVNKKSSNDITDALLYSLKNRDDFKDRKEKANTYSEKFDISKLTKNFDNLYTHIINE